MDIPKEAKEVLKKLKENKFEGYIVGGCVRDFLIKRNPSDWDATTNATPEDLIKIFPKNFINNDFGTVTVLTGSKEETLKEIEITPYRIESKYSDNRHPDEVQWAKTLDEDLSRRDFTINAMAMDLEGNIIDLYEGQKDLKKKIIKTVRDPKDRFEEDALRMMRAVRLATVLDFKVEEETLKAIKENSKLLKNISQERIRDEFIKIINSERAHQGIELLRETDLLKYIIPELLDGYGIGQNKHHIYSIYEHNLLSLKYADEQKFNTYVKVAALLHDVGKPKTKRGDGENSTFYNHEIVGANMTRKILERLKFPKKDIEKIYKLVRYHLFYYNVDEVTESSVRRLVTNVGKENVDELLEVRMCDRIGSGVPKAEPYKLRHLRYLIDKTSQDAISVSMLNISGEEIMKILNIKPGPKIGNIYNILLAEALKDSKNNDKEYLTKRTKELGLLNEEELMKLSKGAKEYKEMVETKKDNMTKDKYWVS
jgi:tRNA nucleotidyltransferase (CCA-adding enzyme)